jgi:hypothetical protein
MILGSDSILFDEDGDDQEKVYLRNQPVTRELGFDDYLLFMVLVTLITFQVLAILKYEDKVHMKWIYVCIPLCLCELFTSFFVFRKTHHKAD